MALAINIKSEIYDLWSDLCSYLLPIKYLTMEQKFDFITINDIDLNFVVNSVFWLLLLFLIGFHVFNNFAHVFLKASKMKSYKRRQFARTLWNLSFYTAEVVFLYLYHKYMILPELDDNSGKLFPKYENIIFYKCQPCERYKLYELAIITFFMHSALLDFKEGDLCEATSKILYSFAVILLIGHRFENYFVVLNINIGIFNIITECLLLMALQTTSKNFLIYQVFLGLRIVSWSHLYVNLLPFKYLVPTLFAKNFKFFLNVFIWLWYGISIWNSPILQYLYHQIYHNTPADCIGEGSAAQCILLKDTVEHRHFKTLRKAYLDVKLSFAKMYSQNAEPNENTSAKAFQAIKCVMTLKRKLRRIREGKESCNDDDENPICVPVTSSS